MVECPFCSAEIEEKYIICPSCDRRVRCEECDELLLAGKDKCYVCGESVHSGPGQSQGANTFHVEEERDEGSFHRSIDIEVSDEGIQEAARIANHFFGRGARREIPKPADEETAPEALPPEAEVSDTEVDANDSEHSTDVRNDQGVSGESALTQEDESSEAETSRRSDIDIRKIDYSYEKIMLALFDLTEREGGKDAVPPIDVYDHLEESYGRNTLSKDSVRSNISHTNYRGKYFEKTDDGEYYLTVEGVNTVESWMNNGYGGEEE
jgi:hypothetical protein